MRTCLAVVGLVFALSQQVRADAIAPGFFQVPHHLILEPSSDYSGYRFFLISIQGSEPLEVAPGKPCRIDGWQRPGAGRLAWVVAVPADEFDHWPGADQWEKTKGYNPYALIQKQNLPPGALISGEIDFHGSVPFYDSRREIIERYWVEIIPGERVRLVLLKRNEAALWLKVAWACAGALGAAGIVWFGRWVVRFGYRLYRRRAPRSARLEPDIVPDRTI